MKTEKLLLANIKCSGCATTIKSELLKIKGVENVLVDVEKDSIDVSYNCSDGGSWLDLKQLSININ
jgi:copper chaperone CopZ